MSNLPPIRIPEERVAAILARAADLDRTAKETVGLDAVRAAALEAGISPVAVERALEEYVSTGIQEDAAVEPGPRSPGHSRWRRLLRAVARRARHAAAALVTGLLVGATGAGGEPLIVAALLAWVVFSGLLVRRHRPSRSARGYILSVVAITLGAAFGFAFAGGDEDVIGGIFFLGLVLTVLGSLVVKVRLPKAFRRRQAGSATPA